MAASNRNAVVAALIGNSFLTALKFAAFLVSGSGAMLSEAIHSLADSGNQGLLYLGIRRSQRPADAMFRYGYGGERYLFSLLSAVGIFVLGCGVTVYHGIHTLLHPGELHLTWLTFAVLGVSFVVDGVVLATAMRAVAAERGDKGFWEHIRSTPDPTVLAVLFEDFVACVGVLVAALGILLSHWTQDPLFDSISSILIGLMLGAVAIWLGYRNRQLILGPAIPTEIERAVIEYMVAQPSVQSVKDIKSRVIAADRFKLKAEIDFDGRHLAGEHLVWARAQISAAQTGETDVEAFVGEFGERMLDSLGREVDRIEAKIVEQFPQLRHLDLEADWAPDD